MNTKYEIGQIVMVPFKITGINIDSKGYISYSICHKANDLVSVNFPMLEQSKLDEILNTKDKEINIFVLASENEFKAFDHKKIAKEICAKYFENIVQNYECTILIDLISEALENAYKEGINHGK